MTRKEFLHCQMCKHCYDHKCRDLLQMKISMCKKHHWPTYDPECPDWEETDAEYNWARAELKKIEGREKMVKLHDLSISWKTAKQCKALIQELFDKLKESDFTIYENVSKPTVELLGRAHEWVRCINIHMTDDILLQTEKDSMDQIQAIVTGTYKRHPEDDEVVIINLYHNGTQINLREI